MAAAIRLTPPRKRVLRAFPLRSTTSFPPEPPLWTHTLAHECAHARGGPLPDCTGHEERAGSEPQPYVGSVVFVLPPELLATRTACASINQTAFWLIRVAGQQQVLLLASTEQLSCTKPSAHRLRGSNWRPLSTQCNPFQHSTVRVLLSPQPWAALCPSV